MAMNPPGGAGGTGDDIVIGAKVKGDPAESQKAGKADGEAYSKGFQEGAEKAGASQRPGTSAAPAGSYRAGAVASAAEARWRTSGQRGAPSAEDIAGQIVAGSTAIPREAVEGDPNRPTDARLRASARQLAAREAAFNQQIARDREKEATAAEKSAATRESRFVSREEELQAAAVRDIERQRRGFLGGVQQVAAGAERRQLRETIQQRADRTRAARQQRQIEAREAATAAREEARASQLDAAFAWTAATEQERRDRVVARQQAVRQRQRDVQISREEQGIGLGARAAIPDIMEGDRGIARGRFPEDLAPSAGAVAGPPGRFTRAAQVARQTTRGGFGPTAQAFTYGASALGQAVLLAAPLWNAVEGGAFGDLPLVGGLAPGDIQSQRALLTQQDRERRAQAFTTLGRARAGFALQEIDIGTARGREARQYGLETAAVGRAGTREAADYARNTAQLQRQIVVDQREYARSSDDLARRRVITERDYARTVEDTAHQRTVLERNFTRQYQDFARQRSDVELRSSRAREDTIRSLTDETIRYTRQQQDLVRQRETLGIGFGRQQQDFARQRETLGIGYARQGEDLAISSGRAEEDYSRQRARAQQDIADTANIRAIESKTALRDQRNQLSDIGMQQFQSVGSLLGAAQGGDPFAIIGALYRMKQLKQEKQIVQENIGRGGFTEVQAAQQGVQGRQQQQGLQDLDREHARQQQDIGLAQRRNEEDYKRGLDEIDIQQKRSVEDYKRGLEEVGIQEKRLNEDRGRDLEALGVQWSRIAQDQGRELAVLDQAQRRYYTDYRDNLGQIGLAEKRHWEDYAENERQIAVAQTRLAQDRVTQLQQEAHARYELDLAHSRALEDTKLQQERLDIGHSQALADTAKQEADLYIARTMAEEDFRKTIETIAREREQQEIALNKEMRSLWEQLAISVGLAGIFAAQIVGSVKYLATFLGALLGGRAVAAAASSIGGDVAIGASQMGPAAARAGSTLLSDMGIIGPPAYVLQKLWEQMTGVTTAEAAEMTTTPGGQNIDTGSGAAPSSDYWANRNGPVRDDWRTNPGTSGTTQTTPGGQNVGTGSGAAPSSDYWNGTPITTSGAVLAMFDAAARSTEKVKGDFASAGDTSGDIQKRFSDSYAFAQDIKDNMGQAAESAVDFKNTVGDAAATFAATVQSVSASLAASSGQNVPGEDPYERRRRLAGDTPSGWNNPLGSGTGTSVGAGGMGVPYGANYESARYGPQEGITYVGGGFGPNATRRMGAQAGVAAGDSNVPQAGTPLASTTMPTMPRVRSVDFGFRSDFYMHRQFGGDVEPGMQYMVGESGPEMFTAGVPGRISPSRNRNDMSSVIDAIDRLRESVTSDRRSFSQATLDRQVGEAVARHLSGRY